MRRNLNFRTAIFKDLDLLAKYDHEVNQTPWTKNQYHSSFNNKHKILILEFKSSREIIASIVFSQIDNNSDILQLWVRQKYVNQGYGKILLNYAIDKLKSDGVTNILLEVVENNLPAISLYQKVGFKYLNLRKNYYRIGGHMVNGMVMQLELPANN